MPPVVPVLPGVAVGLVLPGVPVVPVLPGVPVVPVLPGVPVGPVLPGAGLVVPGAAVSVSFGVPVLPVPPGVPVVLVPPGVPVVLVPPGVPVVLVPPGVPVVLVPPVASVPLAPFAPVAPVLAPGTAGVPVAVEPVPPTLLGLATLPVSVDVPGLVVDPLVEPPGPMVPVDPVPTPVPVPAWASTAPGCAATGVGAAAIETARMNVVIIASSFPEKLRSPAVGESASVQPRRLPPPRRRARGASRGSRPMPMPSSPRCAAPAV
jgi:hypothetical protein